MVVRIDQAGPGLLPSPGAPAESPLGRDISAIATIGVGVPEAPRSSNRKYKNMANPVKTTVDVGSVQIRDIEISDDSFLTFPGAATYLEGSLLAVDSVSLKYVPFVKGGSTNQNGIPKAVLPYSVTSPGAGDQTVRVIVSGVVKKQRLIIIADGNDSNIDRAVLDQLRDYGIQPLSVQDLAALDN